MAGVSFILGVAALVLAEAVVADMLFAVFMASILVVWLPEVVEDADLVHEHDGPMAHARANVRPRPRRVYGPTPLSRRRVRMPDAPPRRSDAPAQGQEAGKAVAPAASFDSLTDGRGIHRFVQRWRERRRSTRGRGLVVQ